MSSRFLRIDFRVIDNGAMNTLNIIQKLKDYSSPYVTFKFKPLRTFLKNVQTFNTRLRELWNSVKIKNSHTLMEIIQNQIKMNFETESYEGDIWEPLSPRYSKWKQKNFPGKKILQLRGNLYNVISDSKGSWLEYDITNNSININENVFDQLVGYSGQLGYWRSHNQDNMGSSKLPKRRFLGINPGKTDDNSLKMKLMNKIVETTMSEISNLFGKILE